MAKPFRRITVAEFRRLSPADRQSYSDDAIKRAEAYEAELARPRNSASGAARRATCRADAGGS